MSYQNTNPYSGELLKSFDEHTDRQLETAITTAATCFDAWRKLALTERAGIVAQAALNKKLIRVPAIDAAA